MADITKEVEKMINLINMGFCWDQTELYMKEDFKMEENMVKV